MAKLRSYNELLLIAASLIASVLNDIVILRRKHSQNRDYSKPINIKDILQKNIEVPCIFGDRSIILKSLENHLGAVKLPLFILQSSTIKTDLVRIADLHVDLIYQKDQQFTRLAKDNPLYHPYDLRRRRPLPITVLYLLTMLAKYKEDLDQMMTNWMVHCRPDLYVKWWHPRDKKSPLLSLILWSQSISYKKPELQPTNKFQYLATTNFTFKTWIFPGLDYLEDAYNTLLDGIIKYFNWFPTDINYTDTEGTLGYPTLGDVGSTPAGFFAVPNNMEFENDGSDLKGIKLGKYYINNLTQSPSGLYNGDNGIKDILATADILTKDVYSQNPTWDQYQDYCLFDNISNDRAGFKAVYFSGGYPLSAMLNTNNNPSGDFLFQHFCSEGNSYLDPISGFYNKIEEDLFGICFTDSVKPIVDYDFNSKIFSVKSKLTNLRYTFNILSYISSTSGITQIINLRNIPSSIYNHDIRLQIIKMLDTDFNIISGIYKNTNKNIKILNNTLFKQNKSPIQLIIETPELQRKLKIIKDTIKQYWDDLLIYPADNKGLKAHLLDIEKNNFLHYKLICNKKRFNNAIKKYANYLNFIMFPIRKEFIENNKEYTLIANNFLYFVLSDLGIYDWNIVSLPRFAAKHYPIFKSTILNGLLTYGIGVDCNLASAIRL